MTDLQHFRKQKNHETSNTAFEHKREAAVLDSIDPKCPFNINTRKTRLALALKARIKRVKNAMQKVEWLKKKEGWMALLKLGPRRHPRRSRAGLTMFEISLWTLVAIGVLVGVLTLYNGVVNSTRTAALRTQLTRAVAIIERDHSRSGIYADETLLGFLNDEGFSEKELERKGPGDYVFTSPFNTPITIEGDGARNFTVTLAGLPPSACEATVSAFSDRGSGLDSVTIAGGSAIEQSDITDAAVSLACDTDADDPAEVVLTF